MKKEIYTEIYQIEKTHWWYVARRKIIFDWVFRLLEQFPEERILDVGCGTGYNIEYMMEQGYQRVQGLDMAPEALGYCISRCINHVTAGDLENLPFASGTFGLVTALDIIEHLDDDQQGINEMARILKPGGTLVVFVPALQFLWSLQDEVGHHCRRYTTRELNWKIRQAGLDVVKLSYANTLLFPLIWAGRVALKLVRNKVNLISEADLNPAWSNGILEKIFSTERSMLRRINFPIGVSILCVCQKPMVNDERF